MIFKTQALIRIESLLCWFWSSVTGIILVRRMLSSSSRKRMKMASQDLSTWPDSPLVVRNFRMNSESKTLLYFIRRLYWLRNRAFRWEVKWSEVITEIALLLRCIWIQIFCQPFQVKLLSFLCQRIGPFSLKENIQEMIVWFELVKWGSCRVVDPEHLVSVNVTIFLARYTVGSLPCFRKVRMLD